MDKKEITKQIENLKSLTGQLESVIIGFLKKESDTIINRSRSQLNNLEIKKLKQEREQIIRNYKILVKKIKIQSGFLIKNLNISKKIEIIPDWALDIKEANKNCFKQINEYGDCDYDPSELFEVPKRIRSYLIQLNKYFKSQFKENKTYPPKISKNTIPFILFDLRTGIGSVNGCKFEFRVGDRPYILFKELYKNLNKPIKRRLVIELLGWNGLIKTKQAKRLRCSITRMRRELGLLINHLILKGDVTLRGRNK